ncbi:hypothetical protein EVAR_77883_1 [Eumeta japonica]|uniref:Uncharacterized protein n=1 Tax=Eumeta variegata TaxID=151549 RepID=A0A4C1TCA4_EUMVA|nr:hypothetical protein EVAR_77883_1 [Eumeta japonica]
MADGLRRGGACRHRLITRLVFIFLGTPEIVSGHDPTICGAEACRCGGVRCELSRLRDRSGPARNVHQRFLLSPAAGGGTTDVDELRLPRDFFEHDRITSLRVSCLRSSVYVRRRAGSCRKRSPSYKTESNRCTRPVIGAVPFRVYRPSFNLHHRLDCARCGAGGRPRAPASIYYSLGARLFHPERRDPRLHGRTVSGAGGPAEEEVRVPALEYLSMDTNLCLIKARALAASAGRKARRRDWPAMTRVQI